MIKDLCTLNRGHAVWKSSLCGKVIGNITQYTVQNAIT